MFEEGLPWYVPTAPEIHAAGYGGFNTFMRAKLPAWDQIPTLGYSPQLTKDIQDEYHYFGLGFYLPRVVVIAVVGIRFIVFTDIFDSKEAVMQLFSLLFGV